MEGADHVRTGLQGYEKERKTKKQALSKAQKSSYERQLSASYVMLSKLAASFAQAAEKCSQNSKGKACLTQNQEHT